MVTDELIADRIEEIINRMFIHSGSLYPKPIEYSIFYDPKRHSSWIILVYFVDSNQLNEAIKNGVCYEVYSFLLNELKATDETSPIERTIFFESGNRPTEQADLDALFQNVVNKMQRLKKGTGEAKGKVCSSCGHDFDNHKLMGEVDEKIGAPTHGWITCPEKDCNCFLTWAADFQRSDE